MDNMISAQNMSTTEFKDIKNNSHSVNHSVILNEKERKEIEEQIVKELYRILTHKVG